MCTHFYMKASTIQVKEGHSQGQESTPTPFQTMVQKKSNFKAVGMAE